MHRLVLVLLTLWSALATAAPAPAQRVWRIMPAGDSITAGGDTFRVYREPLLEKLCAAGYLVEYAGSGKSESRLGSLAHEGHGGKNVEFLAGVIGDAFRKSPADIVLLHAGHNHFDHEKPIPGILAATESIVRTCREINPRVTVLIARVIPAGKLPKYAYIPALNREIPVLAARLDTPASRVIVVDQETGFNVKTDTIADLVHPNANGAQKMAQRWFDALVPLLGSPTLTARPTLHVYKRPAGGELALHVFAPPDARPGDPPRPAVVFFFGGAWKVGTPLQFYPECAALARMGVVAISADYRVAATHRTTPFECIEDGKSAIRWVRQNAAKLGVEPKRIAAAGASAGGQVAASAALTPGFDGPGEDASVSARPDALLLLYPVIDNGPGGFGHAAFGDRWRDVSPLHNVRRGAPPALLLVGTKDVHVPVPMVRSFKEEMEKVGSRCDLMLFEGAGHPIFEYRKGGGEARERILDAMRDFLRGLGWVQSRE